MRATVMHAAHDVRIADVPDAVLVDPTDAVVRVTRASICGSDLWPHHWHGAAPDRFMTHTAMQEADDSGSPVTWDRHVTDEEYTGGEDN